MTGYGHILTIRNAAIAPDLMQLNARRDWRLPCNLQHVTQLSNSFVAAVYHTHLDAEEAVKQLQHAGIDMKTLSIVAKDFHTEEHVVGYYNVGDRMKRWGQSGAFWGGFWGLLFGSAFFAIPGLGPLLVAGPLVGWIVSGLEGAVVVGGVSALGAGLFGMGIPKDSVLQYEAAVRSDKFLLVVNGTAAEIASARKVLETTRSAHLALHSAEELAATV